MIRDIPGMRQGRSPRCREAMARKAGAGLRRHRDQVGVGDFDAEVVEAGRFAVGAFDEDEFEGRLGDGEVGVSVAINPHPVADRPRPPPPKPTAARAISKTATSQLLAQ